MKSSVTNTQLNSTTKQERHKDVPLNEDIAMAWSKERMENNIKTKHPWLSPEQAKQYISITDAAKRRAFIVKLEYRRKKNV